DVVPSIWAVIDRMQQQSLMPRTDREVRFLEQRARNAQTCAEIISPGVFLFSSRKISAQTQQALRRYSRSRAVHRFPRIERIGRSLQIVIKLVQVGRSRVPHRNAIRATVLNIEICCRSRCLEQSRNDPLAAAKCTKLRFIDRLQKLQLLCKSA